MREAISNGCGCSTLARTYMASVVIELISAWNGRHGMSRFAMMTRFSPA